MLRYLKVYFSEPNFIFAPVLFILLLFGSNSYGASFGKLTVRSHLGEPLRAEVELLAVAPEEKKTLVVKLAPIEDYKKSGIDFNPALLSLRFSIEERGSSNIVLISSEQPINDPFLDVLLELGGAFSRLVREYSILLDPVDVFGNAQPAVVAAPLITSPVSGETVPSTNSAEDLFSKSLDTKQEGKPATIRLAPLSFVPGPGQSNSRNIESDNLRKLENLQADGSYKVRPGETLSDIALAARSEDVTLNQMLAALYAENKNAFSKNNLNRLRSGQLLKIPDTNAAQNIDVSEANALVLAHANDFNNYRNSLAADIAEKNTYSEQTVDQVGGGEITAASQASSEVNPDKDHLKVSSVSINNANTEYVGDASVSRKDALDEEKIANERAIAEARSRVQELEKNLASLTKLLESKNQRIVELEEEFSETKDQMQDSKKSENLASPSLNDANSVAPNSVTEQTNTVKEPLQRKPVIVPAAQETFWGSPIFFALIGILFAGLLGFAIYKARRKAASDLPWLDEEVDYMNSPKNDELSEESLRKNDENLQVQASTENLPTESLPASDSVLVSLSSQASSAAEKALENSADLTSIKTDLKAALEQDPANHIARYQLLQLYAKEKNIVDFDNLASKFYTLTRGQGSDWQKIASLGKIIDPKNPLYLEFGAEQAAVEHVVVQESGTDLKTLDFSEENPALPPLSVFEVSQALKSLEANPEAYDAYSQDTYQALVQKMPDSVPNMSSAIENTASVQECPVEADLENSSAIAPGQLLQPSKENLSFEEKNAFSSASSDVIEFSPNDFPDDPEMETKLELAAAYQDIDDVESARSLLETVIQQGSPTQIKKAKILLSSLERADKTIS